MATVLRIMHCSHTTCNSQALYFRTPPQSTQEQATATITVWGSTSCPKPVADTMSEMSPNLCSLIHAHEEESLAGC